MDTKSQDFAVMTSGNRVETRTKASVRAAIALAILLPALLLLPAFASRGTIQTLFLVFTTLTLAQCWNLLAGYAGLVSVGQQAFVGIGAYSLFSMTILLGFDPILAIGLAGIGTVLLAIPTAAVVFRLRGAYFAIGTWVTAEVFRLSFAQWKAVGGGTGTSLPREATSDAFGLDLIQDLLGVRSSAARDILSYWLALLLAIAVIGLIYRFLRSGRGLALAAIRDNEAAAQSLGVDVYRTKFAVYLLAAFGTGLCGALIHFQKASITPDSAFSLMDWTAYVIFAVIIGGIGTIEGPIVGVIVFFLLQSWLSQYGSWYLIALGGLAIGIMLFAPRGIWGYLAARYDLHLFPVRRRLILPGRTAPPKD